VRLFRFSFLAALAALTFTSMLHAAPTGTLVCGSLNVNVSYYDLGTSAASVSTNASGATSTAPFGTLTIHAAQEQFGTLVSGVGINFAGCTLTNNAIQYSLTNVTMTVAIPLTSRIPPLYSQHILQVNAQNYPLNL
jgi:hypothetical protein